MKITKYLMGLALVTAGMLAASCDTENIGATYEPKEANVTFLSEQPEIELQEANAIIPVKVVRANAKGAYTAHYTFTGDSYFSDPNNGTVSFEDGQGSAYINIKATNLEPGKKINFTVTLSDADVATADTVLNNGIYKTTYTVMRVYTWIDFGKGSILSQAWADDPASPVSWELDFQKAEGFEVYKALSVYEEDKHIIIKINGDKAIVEPQPAWNYGDKEGDAFVKGEGTVSGKTVTLALEHYVPSANNYSFGVYTEIFTLP